MSTSHPTDTSSPGNRALVFELLETFCVENGLKLTAGDAHGHAGMVESPDGRRWFFKGTRFDLNPMGCAEIAGDKTYAAKFLEASGIAVPTSHLVFSADIRDRKHLPEVILDFGEKQGFPLFVKPNIGEAGRDVMRVDTCDALRITLGTLAKRHAQLVVQEEIRGKDLRVIVLDGKVLCAFERQPPMVSGDGLRSVAELVDSQSRIDPEDSRIDFELIRQGMTLGSVPASGQMVSLLPVSNLSSGGSAQIVTDRLPPAVDDLARSAVKALGLRYAGVDLIIPVDRRSGAVAIVLEVNAAPGFSKLSRQGPAEARLVKSVYDTLFNATFVE